MEKNTKMEQKKLKIAEKKSKQTKESIQKKQKKRKVEETYPLSRFTSAWLASSEFKSSDSITGKSIPVAIFDLALNERMNGLACWMKLIGGHVQTM